MNDDKQRIVEIEARLGAVTPGEWELEYCDSPDCEREACVTAVRESELDVIARQISDDDAEFIANAPADMRWLLERVKAAEAERDGLRDANRDLLSLRHGSIDARPVKVNEAIGQDGE